MNMLNFSPVSLTHIRTVFRTIVSTYDAVINGISMFSYLCMLELLGIFAINSSFRQFNYFICTMYTRSEDFCSSKTKLLNLSLIYPRKLKTLLSLKKKKLTKKAPR